MSNAEIFFKVGLMGFSLILFVISAISWKRIRSQRLLFVTLAFCLFFIKGLILTVGIFYENVGFEMSTEAIMLDFAILILLYLGIAKK
ncbi:MAG: hypothetical protein KAS16_00650 [Thermoplasmata archaeon]|nr:hypothetical protein [Thermoplasmata archaeon]